jgi:hypothetical protein
MKTKIITAIVAVAIVTLSFTFASRKQAPVVQPVAAEGTVGGFALDAK